jgi:DNA-binding NtrC family response regulator
MDARDTILSTKILEGDQGRLVYSEATIQIVDGERAGAEHPLGPETLVVGSSSHCDIVLPDERVSRRHLEISLTPRGFVARDLGSTNGTYLGSWRIHEVPLAEGMRLRVGDTTLAVVASGKEAGVALGEPGELGDVVAYSPRMRVVTELIAKVAPRETPVLIMGETGTGKQVVAETLHARSRRSGGPFVTVDCGSIPKTLMAAELFGHERGAFTGADTARAGLVAEANGGTLFLDEVGELPLELQPVLLRLIDSREARPIGGSLHTRYDLRFIAATNRNLEQAVREGSFREDLYYRLAVVRLQLPPLRDRPEDIEQLARRFADEEDLLLSADMMTMMLAYRWPGNVRELRNVIRRLAALPEAPPDFLGSRGILPLPEARREANDAFERDYMTRIMAAAQGKVTRAAELAGVSRVMLHRLLSKHQLR